MRNKRNRAGTIKSRPPVVRDFVRPSGRTGKTIHEPAKKRVVGALGDRPDLDLWIQFPQWIKALADSQLRELLIYAFRDRESAIDAGAWKIPMFRTRMERADKLIDDLEHGRVRGGVHVRRRAAKVAARIYEKVAAHLWKTTSTLRASRRTRPHRWELRVVENLGSGDVEVCCVLYDRHGHPYSWRPERALAADTPANLRVAHQAVGAAIRKAVLVVVQEQGKRTLTLVERQERSATRTKRDSRRIPSNEQPAMTERRELVP
jgi:hypothetical protein